MAGKGSKPRPINRKKFDENFNNIDWVSKNNEADKNYNVKKGKKIYRY
jgi:hypothetical protein